MQGAFIAFYGYLALPTGLALDTLVTWAVISTEWPMSVPVPPTNINPVLTPGDPRRSELPPWSPVQPSGAVYGKAQAPPVMFKSDEFMVFPVVISRRRVFPAIGSARVLCKIHGCCSPAPIFTFYTLIGGVQVATIGVGVGSLASTPFLLATHAK